MAQDPIFRVGGVPLNPQRVNKPFLREMYKAAQGTAVGEGKEAALDAITELGKTGEMPKDSFKSLDSFGADVRKEYRSDADRMWEVWRNNGRKWNDPAITEIRKEMGVSGEYLSKNENFITELREATALSAVQAIAGGSFGPAPVIAGYAAYANDRIWNGPAQKNTEDLVNTYKDYLAGDSRMSTEGNSVEQVHREELWRTLTDMTKGAAESGKAGKPQPITAQYYELTSSEMIGNLADAAKAGSPLRLNLDPGRLSYPSKDSKTGNKYYEINDIPHKMRTILQFASIKGADVGVSIFPMNAELNSDPTNLMHRKVLRVGDKVLMSGMNANMGSGENLDAGYVIKGPAARAYTENVVRDIGNSKGSGLEEIWGSKHMELFETEDLRMGRRGLAAMFDSLTGPSPAGTELPKAMELKELEAMAKKAKLNLADIVDVPAKDYDKVMGEVATGKRNVSLSDKGKKTLVGLLEKTIAATQTEKNLKALDDINLPSGRKVGKTKVDIGDLPNEREVLALNAINEAEEFIYLPGFVVTRAIAGAIVAKHKQSVADGKPLDIKIVADSGVYPDGGTPNSWGVNFLEDNGVPVRWSKLTRTGSHDRKIHAKQLLTDKGEIAGSTNFSNKGMRHNWETSAYVHFEAGDKKAETLREQSKEQFEELWNNETYDLSVKDLAAYNTRYHPKVGKDWFVEQDRGYATKIIIGKLESYEKETATLVEGLIETPDVKAKYDELVEKGYSEGDAALMASKEVLGKDEFLKQLHDLPAHKELDALKSTVNNWKARYG